MRHDPAAWKKQYDNTGYLVVEDVLEPRLLARLRAELDRITNDPDSLPPRLKRWIDFERDYVTRHSQHNDLSSAQVGNAIRNIMELPMFSPVFAELIAYRPVLDVLETLFQSSEFSFWNYKCIIKAPRVSSKFRWHRDLPYVTLTSPNLITAMLCVDEMTEANGATVVFPGTHRVTPEEVSPADKDIPDDQLPTSPRVTVCCPAGSLVLFHVSIIHGGGPNRSDIPRRNVIGIWAGPENHPTDATRFAYQGLMPRSKDPSRQLQMKMTFPELSSTA